MPLTEDEVKALRSIFKEELEAQFLPFRAEVDRRFDEVATFRAEVNRRFEDVDRRFEEVNGRFEEVNGRFDRVNRRIDAVANRMATLLRRHQLFRNEVSTRFDEVATYIDGLYKNDETRKQEYLFINEQIRRLEEKFA